jgi:Tfp pilus assembly protein PilF
MTREAADRAFAEAARVFRAGDHAEAFRLTAEAVALDPGHAEAALELAGLLLARRRPDEAERTLRAAAAVSPDHFGLATNLGVLLCQRKRAADGLAWLQRAVRLRPESPVAHYNLANGLKDAGRLSEAIAGYDSAIACDPGFAPAHRNLGNGLIELGRVDEAAAAYRAATLLRRAPDSREISGDEMLASASKLRHDIEQIEHLIGRGILAPERAALAADYRAALAALPPARADGQAVEIPAPHRASLAGTYNRLWHVFAPPALAEGALAPTLDGRAAEADYARNRPGITVIDDFLRPDALHGLRRFCMESTFWFHFKYANGYLGAFMEDGFWCPLLSQIADGLRRALPAIFRAHTLRKCWAFKYDSRLGGIPLHADFAAVNVNFWITPGSANRDPESGGIIVWDKEAPLEWDFAKYNKDDRAIRAFLETSGARSVRIPYRENRVVIFNSDLFHQTDRVAFAEGYENRRINVTLLYGRREAAPPDGN